MREKRKGKTEVEVCVCVCGGGSRGEKREGGAGKEITMSLGSRIDPGNRGRRSKVCENPHSDTSKYQRLQAPKFLSGILLSLL